MLEQELYNQESNNINAQAQPVQAASEPDLFRNYEIKRWDFSPTFYKILAASAIFNVAALVVFAQSNVLMTRGCDSPLVSKFCQVIDTVYVGSVLLGSDTEFSSRDYEKTQLEDADITYIDVSGQTPPLNYPEGYFALANPEEFAMRQQQEMMANGDLNGFTMPPTGSIPVPGMPNSGSDLMNVTPTLPPPNSNPVVGDLPTSPLGTNPIGKGSNNFPMRSYPMPRMPKMPKMKNSSPAKLPDLSGETAKADKKELEEKEKADKIAADKKAAESSNLEAENEEDDDKFNSRPLEDWGKTYGERILKKEIDVNAPFTVEVVAKLDEKGKLIKPKITSTKESNKKMIEVAGAGIAAFSDTRLLKPLYDLGGRDIVITFSQDADNLQAIIKTKAGSPERAKTLQSQLNIILQGASGFMKKDSDEANLMSRAQLGTENNFLVINFLISNEEKTQLIEKSLKSLEEKLKKGQSDNGLAENINSGSVK